MKTVWMVLGTLGFLGGAAFLVISVLVWTGLVRPAEPMLIPGGVVLLVTGLFCLRGAADKTADRGRWRGSKVKVGRLSSFAFGVGFCAMGSVFLGFGWLLPQSYGIWAAAVFVASWVLAVLGQFLDNRAYEREVRRSSQETEAPGQSPTGAGAG